MKFLVLFILLPFFSLSQTINELFSEPTFTDLKKEDKYILISENSQMYVRTKKKKDYKSPKEYLGKLAIFNTFENDGGRYALFDLPDGNTLSITYSPVFNLDGLRSQDKINLIKDSVVGQEYYILKTSWLYKVWEKNKETQTRFFKVTIKDIAPGGSITPYKIFFNKIGDTSLAYAGVSYYNNLTQYSFNSYFSRENPRNLFPSTNDETWSLIVVEKVKVGMNKNECELSWGKPKNINRTTTAKGSNEQWVYDNGYLYFTNGILEAIQN